MKTKIPITSIEIGDETSFNPSFLQYARLSKTAPKTPKFQPATAVKMKYGRKGNKAATSIVVNITPSVPGNKAAPI